MIRDDPPLRSWQASRRGAGGRGWGGRATILGAGSWREKELKCVTVEMGPGRSESTAEGRGLRTWRKGVREGLTINIAIVINLGETRKKFQTEKIRKKMESTL